MPSKKKGKEKEKEKEYEPAIVTFVDILGFRSLLDRRSATEIFDLLSKFREFTNPHDHDGLEDEVAAKLVSRAYAQSVSDAIVRVRPYNREQHDGALFYELIDLLHAQLELIASGVLVRAGVTLGNVYIGKRREPIFGPGLRDAFELESKKAIFPRIAIEGTVVRSHKVDPRLRSEDNTIEYEVRTISSLLKRESKNLYFIDYLKDAFDELGEGAYLTFLQRHAKLIKDGLTSTDPSTRKKFVWLKKYHNQHVRKEQSSVMKSKRNIKYFMDEYGIHPKDFYKSIII